MKNAHLVLLLLFPLSSFAATDWIKAAVLFTDNTVVPAYTVFVDASTRLQNTARAYCNAKGNTSKGDLIQAYHGAMDGWQGVQIYRLGPAQPFMRHGRVATWPGIDKIVDKQLRTLLNTEDASTLEMSRFTRSSTAIQGFPALERLLFGGSKTTAPITPGNYACDLAVTIAINLQTIGEDMRAGWQEGHKEQILHAGQTDSYLTGPEDVAGEMLTDFYMQVFSIADQKLGRPYGNGNFRYKRAESWRGQRSLRNIKINLRSAEDYYRNLFMPAMQRSELNGEIINLLADAQSTARKLDDSFAIANENSPASIKHLQSTLLKLSNAIEQKMPAQLDITIGFNALDGDG